VRTKIVCTMGPSVSSVDTLKILVEAGMSVARLNFSHGTHADHLETIKKLKEVRKELKKPVALMLDTKGPEIRVLDLSANPLKVNPKMRVWLVKSKDDAEENTPFIKIHPEEIVDHLKPKMSVLIDDGYVQGTIIENDGKKAILEIFNSGEIKLKKSINIPDLDYHLPILSQDDIDDLRFGAENDIDIVALSFVTNAEQVLQVRKILRDFNQPQTLILSKIESANGVKNFDSILEVSDGIMVARGDLGVELPIEKIPTLQKRFIAKCLKVGKPVIVATQMLESMIKNPRPTRAEASDVAGAIFDAASAIMLSGETAVGAYPIETVKTMRKIGHETEEAFSYEDYFFKRANENYYHVSEAIACATVHATYMTRSKMIVVCTHSGETARQISKFRPEAKIIAITADEKTYHQMSITWGVIPILKDVKTMQEAIKIASDYALKHGICQIGDLIVVTSGALFGIQGSTNMLAFESIGEVLVRGVYGNIRELCVGQVVKIGAKEKLSKSKIEGKIALMSCCQKEDFETLKHAKGVILQNATEDLESMMVCQMLEEHKIPAICRAEGALDIIKENDYVTLDSIRGLVFKGKLERN
jgi:pyruvate kinase